MIAVIDDGIEISDFLNINCNKFYKIDFENNIIPITPVQSMPNTYSHATTCAAIINHYCDDVELISISVLSESKTGSINNLVTAIKWCIDNEIPLINLSIGSVILKDFKILNELIKSLQNKCLIVAAQNNNKYFTSPASFNEVIGVKKHSIYCDDQYNIQWYPFDGIEISASSNHKLKRKDGSIYTPKICNSFATPMITAKVYKILAENNFYVMSKEQILLQLQDDAVNVDGRYIKNFLPYHTSHNYIENLDIKSSDYFWDRTMYDRLLFKYIKTGSTEISVPIINFNKYNHGLISELVKIFLKHKYEPCVILRDKVDSLDCMYYLFADTVNHIDMCSYINKRLKYDVFITQSDKLSGDIDLVITNDNITVIINDDKYENKVYLTNDEDIRECVKYILIALM